MTTPASALIRASIAAPSSTCAVAATAKHGDPGKCHACREAWRVWYRWDRDHPRVDLNRPDVATALAGLLDAIDGLDEVKRGWLAAEVEDARDALEDAQHALTRAFVTVEQAITKGGQVHMKPEQEI